MKLVEYLAYMKGVYLTNNKLNNTSSNKNWHAEEEI